MERTELRPHVEENQVKRMFLVCSLQQLQGPLILAECDIDGGDFI